MSGGTQPTHLKIGFSHTFPFPSSFPFTFPLIRCPDQKNTESSRQSVTMTLDCLPAELLLHVASNLSAHGVCNLSRTCKHINKLVHPLIWTSIDLHPEGYQDPEAELKVPEPFISPSQRVECRKGNASDLFRVLRVDNASGTGRPKELMAEVKSLCTFVDVSSSVHVWHLLPQFTNLETLNLHTDCWYSRRWNEVSIPEVSTLQSPNFDTQSSSAISRVHLPSGWFFDVN